MVILHFRFRRPGVLLRVRVSRGRPVEARAEGQRAPATPWGGVGQSPQGGEDGGDTFGWLGQVSPPPSIGWKKNMAPKAPKKILPLFSPYGHWRSRVSPPWFGWLFRVGGIVREESSSGCQNGFGLWLNRYWKPDGWHHVPAPFAQCSKIIKHWYYILMMKL